MRKLATKRPKLAVRFSWKKLLYVLLFLTAWVLFGFNTKNADHVQYEFAYNSYSLDAHGSTNELGFRLLCVAFNTIGCPYQLFIIIYSFVGLYIMFKSIKEYTDQYLVWAVCYLVYPFAFDVPQIRTFAVEVIVVYAIRYLAKFERESILKYLAYILISTLFHSIGIIYLILMLAYLKDTKMIVKISGIVTGGLVMVSLFAQGLVNIVFRMLSFLGENVRGVGYIVFWDSLRKLMFEYLAIGLLIIALNYFNSKYLEKIRVKDNRTEVIRVIEKVTYISLMLIPLMSFGPSFGRLFSRLWPLLYCGLLQKSKLMKTGKVSMRVVLSNCACIGLVAMMFYFHVYTGDQNSFERVFKVLFENNLLF